MDLNDLVYNRNQKGEIMSGGYTIKSIMSSINSNTNMKGGATNSAKFDDAFKDLAVPAGLLYVQKSQQIGDELPVTKDALFLSYDTIDEALYDKLVNLASYNKNKHSSNSKHSSKEKKTTRKNKRKSKAKSNKKKSKSTK